MTITYSLEDLPNVAQKVLAQLKNKIVLFDAEMGVGKTTLIKEICKQLGVQDVISSPTFALVNEYLGNSGVIYHFDFYRIKDEEEAYQIGFEEYLSSDAWVFIEWPDKIANLLPPDSSTISIKVTNDKKRVLTYQIR
ncbi:tRNA (adenosine(37)-N6)-threonylcarbamoyltransferase complex ATPase subunit type 1 TsaE [Aquimarina sp. U1-2]|uniref:tRNA (adenosine(37)-N6)-threonylcarbamoyltransferase complex ATPase subunit type 1 TsaE n=1 Tax=Aquimarina sp. U1-2 TaxID=2823141 RepID=UPI001AECA196|nr:tRNA (adenosine(37)-N6)-threonylcarbamoyltransferase complex ATPase subunit type 1 TsaE [Aquimarina sp. U1-2]MBP2832644.1 tRNA (adenosine(37)-N6)-threonylcarbamoyltransferase complex ATPase subunit type 1 TsaE [Aquimarina sp. U1-2]